MSMQNLFDCKSAGDDDVGHHKISQIKFFSKSTIPCGKNRANSTLKIDPKDKELVNSGLSKLASSFKSKERKLQKALIKKNESKSPVSLPNQITEKPVEPNLPLPLKKGTSIDAYTMTDFKEPDIKENGPQLKMEPEASEEQPYKDLQWTDPRLLRKYSLVKQPYRKSNTIPYSAKSDCNVETLENSDDETDTTHPDKRHFIFKCLFYFCTASVSFIGGMCGITLITIILWKLLDEHVLNYHIEPPQHLFFTRLVTNLLSSLFCAINAVVGRLMRLLTMSSSEAFAIDGEPKPWYKLY